MISAWVAEWVTVGESSIILGGVRQWNDPRI
jgi:hypothetical protein